MKADFVNFFFFCEGQRETILKPLDGDRVKDRIMDFTPRLHDRQEANGKRKDASNHTSFRRDDTDISGISDDFLAPPPPPPFPLLSMQEVTKPIVAAEVSSRVPKKPNSSSLKVFTIASLQQYTNSFSEDNLLGRGMLGSVYRAELPSGRVR